MDNKKKIGFLGGTFDPIHHGHLSLALEVLEKRKLDEIWFCPTSISPFKLNNFPASINHRLNMVELAIKPFKQFKVIDIEANNNGPSFSYETLVKLNKKFPHFSFSLILSDDHLATFNQWHEIKKILDEFELVLAKRSLTTHTPQELNLFKENYLNRLVIDAIIDVRTLEISSTMIRGRLKNKLHIDPFVPSIVLDYICKNKLYY